MTNKEMNELIDHIVNLEGQYGNDPYDSGGQTKYGITETTARSCGYNGCMKELPITTAKEIYASMYIQKPKFDLVFNICPQLASDLIDFGINQGPATSARMLQRWLNALNDGGKYYKDQALDGQIGPSTLGQLEAFVKQRGSTQVLLKGIRSSQGVHYLDISEKSPKNERFLYGWVQNRV